MKFKIIFTILLTVQLYTFSFHPAQAQTRTQRYITIVNPVRGKSFWKDIRYVKDYFLFLQNQKVPSTWLIQYDNLFDQEFISIFKSLPKDQELGLFLEVSEKLADDALVAYLFGTGDWARSDKILLSGYSPADRLRLIDKMFEQFKRVTGTYPQSIGAWYIDTLSLNYIADTYKVKAALVVADQFQTDGYGIWGIPWGIPFVPSRFNSLVPAQTAQNGIDIVMMQWAPRDPYLGYGLNVSDSTYSIQANDYKDHHGLDTSYFIKLADSYLSASETSNQLTIGLEVGQESVRFLGELENQVTALKSEYGENLNFTTMKDFYSVFKKDASKSAFFIRGTHIKDPKQESYWYISPFYRIRMSILDNTLTIDDLRIYNDTFTFSDIGSADKNTKILREIPSCIDSLLHGNAFQLLKNISSIEVLKRNNIVHITANSSSNPQEIKILMDINNIQINDRIIYEYKKTDSITQNLTTFLKSSFLQIQEFKYHSFLPSIRFTKLEHTYFAGLMYKPTQIIGFKSQQPYIGIFTFPFQTLIRFKSFPHPDFDRYTADYFYSHTPQCTIKL